MSHSYHTDFYAWAVEQAALLREGRLASADVANIAEEIESMGRAEKRELVNLLTILLLDLLKWHFQPGFRSASWNPSIRGQATRHPQACFPKTRPYDFKEAAGDESCPDLGPRPRDRDAFLALLHIKPSLTN